MAASKFTFLGFGKRSTKKAETDEEKKKREADEAKAKKAETDEDCEDEDEAKADGEDAKAAVRLRNALRAAGHRRGVAATLERFAVIFTDLDPDKAAMGVSLALGEKTMALPGDQVRALLDAAPAPSAEGVTPFEKVMGRISETLPGPSFSDGPDATKKGPTLAGQMAKTLGLPAPKN